VKEAEEEQRSLAMGAAEAHCSTVLAEEVQVASLRGAEVEGLSRCLLGVMEAGVEDSRMSACHWFLAPDLVFAEEVECLGRAVVEEPGLLLELGVGALDNYLLEVKEVGENSPVVAVVPNLPLVSWAAAEEVVDQDSQDSNLPALGWAHARRQASQPLQWVEGLGSAAEAAEEETVCLAVL